ncbi:MAG: M23 family metallopeptidase [Bdellovibrionales bacterium]|nr:M23 family metallopeptidase [Bdellovibrionales bacterium]
MVPSGDGRVKKLRISLRRMMCVSLAGLMLGCGLLYMAGNYTRVQILWNRSLEVLSSVTKERNFLVANKGQLKRQIAQLEAQREKAREFEGEVLRRIDELRSVLDSASKDGIVPESEVLIENSASDNPSDQEIGGAEIDCEDAACGRAHPQFDLTRSQFRSYLGGPSKLVTRLDETIDLVRSIPIGYPGNGHINSLFGPRRSPFSGKVRMHQGIDLALPLGSGVRATAEGVVRSVKRTSTYGLVIDVDHGTRVMTRYAHLSEALVSDGERVCQGELIGLSGSSGFSTGPHLHYEIHVDSKAVDPVGLMEAATNLLRLVEVDFHKDTNRYGAVEG